MMERVQPMAMMSERRRRVRLWKAVMGLRMRGPMRGDDDGDADVDVW